MQINLNVYMNKNAFILHIAIGVNVKQNLFSFSGIPRVCNKIQLQLNFSFFNIHVNDISDINVPWICQSELEVPISVSLCISSKLYYVILHCLNVCPMNIHYYS